MTFKFKAEENISGDWSASVQVGDELLSFYFPTIPTQAMIDSAAQNYIDNPPEDIDEELINDTTD